MEDSTPRESDPVAVELYAEVGAAALGVGTAILTDPMGGLMVNAAAAPVIKATLERIFGLRGRQVAAMWEIAVRAAGQTHQELLEQVTADPHRAQLFSAAVRAATDTALESKLEVLGQLLVQGLLHGDQAVDEARLLTVAVGEIERLHLRVLDQLTKRDGEGLGEEERATAGTEAPPGVRWPFDLLAQRLGVTPSALEIVIGALVGRGLIHGGGDVYGGTPPAQAEWMLTGPGRTVLEFFRRAGEAAAGPANARAGRNDC